MASPIISPGGFSGVQPEQGPPLVVPLTFFGLAMVALLASGVLLMLQGSWPLAHRALPGALALTHIGTLGFLGAVMMGALYQMVPVVGGVGVPLPSFAWPSSVALAVGTLVLTGAFLTGSTSLTVSSTALLMVLLATFVGPVGFALVTAPTRSATVWGIRLALAGLATVLVLGALLIGLRFGMAVPAPWTTLLYSHIGLGALVWVGGLIVSVSWKVIPMFYVAPGPPPVVPTLSLAALGVGLVGAWLSVLLGWPGWVVAAFLTPAGLAVLAVHPALWAWQLLRRKRRRPDASLLFWWAATLTGPLTGFIMGVSGALEAGWGPILATWMFLFGWAGLIAHGMLTRIVPFLVWFHRCAARVGEVDVPPMRQLWTDGSVRFGFVVHTLTIVLGASAVVSNAPLLARLTGLGLSSTAVFIAVGIFRTLRRAG